MNSDLSDVKPHEYELLNEIAQDSLVTQSNLSQRLGIAVGSVNWYIKRLIHRGWVKVSRLDRTRLQYDLTSEGMKVFSRRAMLYARDSLKVYRTLRDKATAIVQELKQNGIASVCLEGDDEMMDIMRLTCIENGIIISSVSTGTILKYNDQDYQIVHR